MVNPFNPRFRGADQNELLAGRRLPGLDRLHPQTGGGYDSSGINPGGNFYPGLGGGQHPIGTGGAWPAVQVPPHVTLPPGDPAHPVPNMHTGGPLPPQQVPPASNFHPPQAPPATPPGAPAPQQQQASFAPVDIVQQMINGMMKGQYGQDAARRGMEIANQRGLLNSSMAAGNSQRAALESISPFVQQGMGLLGQREQNAFQQQLQQDQAFQQDWLNNRNFNRDFYSAMSMIPMQSAAQLQQMMAQYALDNPDVYTPNNLAGMQQFFNDSLRNIMSQYFGNATTAGGK